MLRKFIDLLLYGHFWIALAAWLMQVQTQLLYFGEWRSSALDGFVAAGTLVIYALHRLVAMRMKKAPIYAGRFQIMNTFQLHIMMYMLVAGLLGAWFFWQLPLQTQLVLLMPSLLALAYVLPLFRGRRLRDFPYLKIFLIALCWAWITVVGPVMYWGGAIDQTLGLIFIERAFFVFAITIPFDIRDLILDLEGEVSTIPGQLGIEQAKRIAYAALGIAFLCVLLNLWTTQYAGLTTAALVLSLLVSGLLIRYSHPHRHDYYFTGALDGTMVLQALMVWLLFL
ncbi:MAG: UbiA family prenyltransferase [Bacteroidota bacterium]